MARKSGVEVGDQLLLPLTQLQREAIIHCTRIRSRVKERLKQAGDGTRIVTVTQKELEHLDEELSQAALFAPSPYKKRLVEVLHKVADLIADANPAASTGKPKTRKSAPKTGTLIYQFKITLLDTKPVIWRRIQVADCDLADLHDYIQAAFGWWNYHLHQFLIDGERYGPPAPDGFDPLDDMLDETGVMLSKLIPKSGRRTRWIYEYDFGDDWRHEVLFEGFPPADPKAKYPLCLEGDRACPPEDCGGPWGFLEYLAIMRNPKHKDHKGMLEWRGPFDPEEFDAGEARKEMRKVKRASRRK